MTRATTLCTPVIAKASGYRVMSAQRGEGALSVRNNRTFVKTASEFGEIYHLGEKLLRESTPCSRDPRPSLRTGAVKGHPHPCER